MEQAKALERELKSLKDDIHRRPELSFEERRTTAILKEKLTVLGLEIIDLGMETGVVAVLRGGLSGGTVRRGEIAVAEPGSIERNCSLSVPTGGRGDAGCTGDD